MRFSLPACKYEGLQFGHKSFYDLMSLLEAISLNVAKEKVKKSSRKILKAFAPENLVKLHNLLHQQMAAPIQSQGTYSNHGWICY